MKCSTKQHTATYSSNYNKLQHAASRCNTLQHAAPVPASSSAGKSAATQWKTHIATYCNTHHNTTHRNILQHKSQHTATQIATQHIATYFNTHPNTVQPTHCSTLHHIATQCTLHTSVGIQTRRQKLVPQPQPCTHDFNPSFEQQFERGSWAAVLHNMRQRHM